MILQKKNWKEIRSWFFKKQHHKEENLVWLLDIDDTLIKCSSYKGSTEWFNSEMKHCKKPEIVISDWAQLVPYLKFELCCDWLPSFLNKINGDFFAVTSRHCAVQKHTHRHLEEAGFVRIKDVISCGKLAKPLMVNYYVQPQNNKYIFIDDKWKNVLEMHKCYPNMICIWINDKVSLKTKLYQRFFL